MGRQALALLRQLDAACAAASDLEQAVIESFNQHPDAGIITSFPGLGPLTGARVLAETGDDRSRFADAKGLKAYAGAAPVTRASGKSIAIFHRRVKNQRLAAAGYIWAFAALTASPGARAHYDRRRQAGDRHTAAQRGRASSARSSSSSAPVPSPRRRLSAFTQLPSVPALIPRSRATCAVGLPVSRTSRTAPSRKSASNFLRVSATAPPSKAMSPRYEGKPNALLATADGGLTARRRMPARY
jgi:hypothetical protein